MHHGAVDVCRDGAEPGLFTARFELRGWRFFWGRSVWHGLGNVAVIRLRCIAVPLHFKEGDFQLWISGSVRQAKPKKTLHNLKSKKDP